MTMMAGSVVMSMPPSDQNAYYPSPLPHYREIFSVPSSLGPASDSQSPPPPGSALSSPSPASSSSSRSSSPVATSPGGLLRVLGYYPAQGPVGSAVSVSLRLLGSPEQMVFLRLVIGRTALNTNVRMHSDTWELRAVVGTDVPPRARTDAFTVQALNKRDEVLDSLTFGTFTYTQPRESPLCSCGVRMLIGWCSPWQPVWRSEAPQP